MIRRPDTTYAVVDTRNGLFGALVLLATGLLQHVCLDTDLLGLEVPHANCLLSSVDVLSLDDWVLVRSW